MPIITLGNRNQWRFIIRIHSIDEAIPLFQQVLAIRRTLKTPISSEMNLHFAFAFAELLYKLHRKKNCSLMKKLNCSVDELKELSDISIGSYSSSRMQKFGFNIMLEVAGHLDMEWADYVYQLAQTRGIADAITHGTAIKLLGRTQRFQEAEYAFARLNHLHMPTPSTMAIAHGAMIQACFLNKQYSRALEIYHLAESRNVTNAIIRIMMIKIAGSLALPDLAKKFLDEVSTDPTVSDYTFKIAKSHFRRFVTKAATNPSQVKAFHSTPPALPPAAEQRPATTLYSLFPPIHADNCYSTKLFSDNDPIYTPSPDQPSPGRGYVGDRIGMDVPLRPTAAKWRPTLFNWAAKTGAGYNHLTVQTEGNASRSTFQPR